MPDSGRQRPECCRSGNCVVLPIFILLESDLVDPLGPGLLLYPWPACRLSCHYLASPSYLPPQEINMRSGKEGA